MNRILMIDDDEELCALIKRSIMAENIEADSCSTGKEGLAKLKEKEYQLVILDVLMPGMDGFETLEKIRQENDVPILMFTSRDDSISKVRGLRAGADDYVTKPFDMEELTARILSLIRRYTRFSRENQDDGRLVFFARNQGKILTKQRIYEEVWKEEYCYDDSNIMAVISRLRKKIEAPFGKTKYIQTIKGIGYRFNKEV